MIKFFVRPHFITVNIRSIIELIVVFGDDFFVTNLKFDVDFSQQLMSLGGSTHNVRFGLLKKDQPQKYSFKILSDSIGIFDIALKNIQYSDFLGQVKNIPDLSLQLTVIAKKAPEVNIHLQTEEVCCESHESVEFVVENLGLGAGFRSQISLWGPNQTFLGKVLLDELNAQSVQYAQIPIYLQKTGGKYPLNFYVKCFDEFGQEYEFRKQYFIKSIRLDSRSFEQSQLAQSHEHQLIFNKLFDGFNREELNVLCFYFGIKQDEFNNIHLKEYILEIIQYFERRQQLNDLITYIQNMRPNN